MLCPNGGPTAPQTASPRQSSAVCRDACARALHVVRWVRKLGQNHPHVVAQRQQHLAEVLGLGTRPRLKHPAHLRRPSQSPAPSDQTVARRRPGSCSALHRVVRSARCSSFPTPFPRPPRAPRRSGGRCSSPPCDNVLVRVKRHVKGLANGFALDALEFLAARNSPGTAEGSLAFPLEIEFHPQVRHSPSKRTPRSSPQDPAACTTFVHD